jgi:sugar diacid utilization regulator
MIQVNEILKLAPFHNFGIICGEKFLSNTVNAAVILEYESSRIQFEGYGYGYFVLFSYFFASTNSEFVNDSLKTLIKKHVSGIAIKKQPDTKLPEDIVQLAIDNHVPLLSFYQEFMEDLIININECMKTRAQYIINEEKVHTLINGIFTPESVKETALEINYNFKPNAIVANMSSKEPADNQKILLYFDNLMYHQFHSNETYSYSFVKLGFNLILICTFDNNELKNFNAYKYIKDILITSGFSPSSFYTGLCTTPVTLEMLNYSLIKAQDANFICKFRNAESISYETVGIDKYVIPYIKSRPLRDDIVSKIKILKDYDNMHESNLLNTLIHYVNDNGNYNKTSKECFQHINTIRYRIKKAEQLLSLEESTADEEILIIIRCYIFLQIIESS